MIASIRFQNFRVLRDATLPLSPFTLIVGPNGSGKSTALQALQLLRDNPGFERIITAGSPLDGSTPVELALRWEKPHQGYVTHIRCLRQATKVWTNDSNGHRDDDSSLEETLRRTWVYALDAKAIAQPCTLQPQLVLREDGAGFAIVLDQLRDRFPERFEALNSELARLIPEFDRILFVTPRDGTRCFELRQREGHNAIPASDLSQGTLIALAILVLAYMPNPPSVIGLEEPDRAMHPRLLRDIRDALYRLSYPDKFGEKRQPVQVIATTHSPFFLDLFRDHPEEIVIANKVGQEAKFERLSDRPDINELLGDASLGDVWYSGILGGVPCEK